MPTVTLESLLADLARAELLGPKQYAKVEQAARDGAHPPDKIVKRLVEKGWVTAYQGEELLAGRAAGLLFGPYVLLDVIGEGGMGRVYKARHRWLGRVDAVKVIRADKVSSKVLARRFRREIRLTSKLTHPNIVRAFGAGEVGRQPYLATEWVRGEDLATVVRRRGALCVADACSAVYQAALALQYIHECGLVHRDVKPSNLMREEATGVVKLLDLGLSGITGVGDMNSVAGQLTTAGMMIGTPDYVAPEQIRDSHGVDIRADLYSLGCTFFFLLTGRLPYVGSPLDRLTAHTSDPIPPLVLPTGPPPPAVAAVVYTLMAKRPEDRYPTPQALADALRALPSGHPSAMTETPAPGSLTDTAAPFAFDPSSVHAGKEESPPPRPGRFARFRRVDWTPWLLVGAGVVGLVLAVVLAINMKARTDRDAPTRPQPASSKR